MFRFLGCCNCCTPSTDVLTAEDRLVFATSGQEKPDSNPAIHGSHSFQNGTKYSNPSSKSVIPQDSSADPVGSQFSPSNSRAGVEQSIRTTLHNAPDRSTTRAKQAEFPSLPFDSQAIEQGIGAVLQDAHHFSIGGNVRFVTIGQQNVNNRGTNASQVLDNRLKEFVSFSALHDSSAQDPERCCHPGTRKNVIHRMRTWMDDLNPLERILWLHGPAGVGKSAIAQTISSLYNQDKVGATFFFFRSDPIRNDGNRLVPTLAWQLALSVPDVNKLIAFSLEKYPDIPRKAVEVQFDKLITQPFLTVSGDDSIAPTSTRIIIIDGLDECSDVKLQERTLKIIGNAVSNARFPLRFVISSRPEANIQDFFDQFQSPTLRIDLANVDDAFRDIETYLRSEFARIAVEQRLDPKTWPAQGVIDSLVSKSSGQFVYASTVMKYVGDRYESAVAQLNIVLGLRPRNGKSPFAELDALYAEILQRQPDQNFLKEFLPVLVARSMLSGMKDGNLHQDDAMLLDVDETQLHRKLRGMRSILKFEPFLDVHHKSFLDFLDDSSRPGEYHVGKHFANRRYMQRITDVLVRDASKVMEQPNSHGRDHFQPRFAKAINKFPLKIELLLDDLEEILQPLLAIQEKLLQLPRMSIPWKPRACEDCWTFYMIDDLLLHLACLRGSIQVQEPKYVGIRPLTAMEEKQVIPQHDLDTCLSLLLAELRSVEPQLSDAIGLVRVLVRFDPTETAMKVRSITDAQNLVELIFCLNKKECFKSWFGAAAHSATRLALAIYGRMPVLPRSLFLNSADLNRYKRTYQGKTVKIWNNLSFVWRDCFDAFMWGNLSHDSIVPCLGICFQSKIVTISQSPENKTVEEWRRSTNYSVSKIQAILFEVAKAVQYIYSFGIVLNYSITADDIYLDSDNHVKLQCLYFIRNDLCKGQLDYEGTENLGPEDDIRDFGLLFYQVLFDERIYDKPETRPRKPKIADNIWQLIQWCCTKDRKEGPTIDQVVQEMESWISLGQFTSLT